MRELLWNPVTRNEFLGIINQFEPSLEMLIENCLNPVERYGEMQYDGIVITGYSEEAMFRSSLCTKEFIHFLMYLFDRYDHRMGTDISLTLTREYDIYGICSYVEPQIPY